MLDKLLELILAKAKLLNELTSCTKFMCFLMSVKLTVNQNKLSAYDIMKNILKLDNAEGQKIRLIGGPREFRANECFNFNSAGSDLTVVPTELTFYGIYLPIKQWSDFDVYKPESLEEQLKQVS